MTRTEWLQIQAVLQNAYPREPMTTTRMDLYFQMLQDLAAPTVKEAAIAHVATSPFWPAISELRKQAAAVLAPVLAPEIAWGEVQEQIRKVGRYRTPRWSCDAVSAAVSAIGWATLCDSTEPGVERAHFFRIFGAYRDRETLCVTVGQITRGSAQEQVEAAQRALAEKAS